MPVVAFNPLGSHLNLTLSKFIGGHDENCTLFERIYFAIDGLRNNEDGEFEFRVVLILVTTYTRAL